MSVRGKPLPEVCRVLASELAYEISNEGVEQCRFLMVNGKSNQSGIVLVTTTDRASELLLAYLDEQVEEGIITNSETTWRNPEAKL